MSRDESAGDDSLYPIAVLIDELRNEDVQVKHLKQDFLIWSQPFRELEHTSIQFATNLRRPTFKQKRNMSEREKCVKRTVRSMSNLFAIILWLHLSLDSLVIKLGVKIVLSSSYVVTKWLIWVEMPFRQGKIHLGAISVKVHSKMLLVSFVEATVV